MTNQNGMAGKGYFAEGARGSAGPVNVPPRDKIVTALSKTFGAAAAERPDDDIVTTMEQLLALPATTVFLMADGRVGRTRVRAIASLDLDGGVLALSANNIPLPVKVIWRPDRPQLLTTTSERTQP